MKKNNLNIKKCKLIYSYWKKNNLFKPNINKNNKKNFSIIMPPPNITGYLHIGHAFQQIIMDLIIRYKKMSGYNTLWIMGTDHAGISTQIIVENYIKKKHKTLKKISKKKIINEIWKWKKKHEKKIYQQTKILGSSVDWSNTCFSLDKNFTKSVQKIFIYLYKKKLIYKTKKAMYWDKKIKCVLSDLEINKEKKILKNYFIKLNFLKNNDFIIIETTQPELLLGTIALGIKNKNKKLIGKKLINPLTKNIIKIIYNKKIKYSKKKKYTKIIPGHKINHLIYCKKFNLDIINIYNLDGSFKKKIKILNYKWKKKKKINISKILKIKKFNSKYVKKKIINFLKKKKYILKIKKKISNIYLSNKTNSRLIIIITNQWYLKTNPLAKKAISLVKKKKIIFIPTKYKKIFFKWMENIQDWCISRQIYWGHKIPIWYDKNNNVYVGKNKKKILSKYNIKNKLKQDTNVLDTWFSSSIWAFTSLGWPKNHILLKKFYPINLIVSGFDIIFFWISRMIMISSYISKKYSYLKIPFKKVLLTGLIRDENGKKMSKSIGNVIDPIDIIKGIKLSKLIKKRTKNIIKEKSICKIIKDTKKNFPNGIKSYGVDVLRHTLCSMSNTKIKINFDIKKLNHSFNYCNKIWNIYIFIFKYLKIKINKKKININKLNLTEYWVYYNINILIKNFKKNIKEFRFDIINQVMFFFIKNIFSDWYIEITKIKIKNNCLNTNNKLILTHIFIKILKLSHPITPFITEYIWKKINKNNSILKTKLPKYKNNFNNHNIIKIFITIQKIITYIRKINKKNKKEINILIILDINLNKKKIFIENIYLFKLIKINKIIFSKKNIFNQSNLKKKEIKFTKIKINNVNLIYY